jgi:hypothetical protein
MKSRVIMFAICATIAVAYLVGDQYTRCTLTHAEVQVEAVAVQTIVYQR